MAKTNTEQQHTGLKAKVVRSAKISAGLLLMTIFPKRRERMQKLATIPWHAENQPDAIDRLIRIGLLWWRSRDSSGQDLAQMHQEFWREQSSANYYAGTQNRFEKLFLPHFDHFLDQVATEATSRELNCLVEIGCGDGQLLRRMQQRIPMQRYVGLDLSEDQINSNKANAGAQGPEYFSGDAAEWIASNAPSHTLYVTCLGVLEYFTQAQLSSLLESISRELGPATAMFIEPIDPQADLQNFDASYVAGEEHSFTHNYAKRLQQAGWTMLHYEEMHVAPYRWTVSIACCE